MNTKLLLIDLALFYVAAIWGSTFFIVKDTIASINPVALVAYRFIFASVILLVWLALKRQNPFENFLQGAVPGFFLWLMYITQTFGLLFTTASNSGFISSLYVVFVPVFSFFLFRKLPTSQKWVSAIVAMCGLFLLTGGLTGINAGDALTLACALASAAQIIYSDKYVKGGTNPVVLAFQQFFVVGMLSLAVAFIFSLPFSIGSAQAGMSIAFLTIFPTLSAYVIQLIAQKRTDPVKVGLILSFESVFAAVFAWTLGGERFDAIKAIGGILVFGALVFSEVPLDKIKKLFSKSKPARSGGHG